MKTISILSITTLLLSSLSFAQSQTHGKLAPLKCRADSRVSRS